MNAEELKNLSREELINVVTNLESRYSAGHENISSLKVDYRDLLEATSDIIFVIDKNENLIYRNAAHVKQYPSLSKEKLCDHYTKFLPHVEKKRGTVVLDQVIKKGIVIKDELMRTSSESGEVLYFVTSFSPIKSGSGEIIGAVGIMKNITEHHLAEKKVKENSRILEEKANELLRQSEELKNLRDMNDDIIENAPFGIFIIGPTGVMLSENPTLMKIMGRDPGKTLVGENLFNHQSFINSDFGKTVLKCLNDKKSDKIHNSPYFPISAKRELIIDATVDPIFDKNGAVDKIIIMVEDNTDHAMIQERMKRAEKNSALGLLASGVASGLKDSVTKMVMDLNFVTNNVDEDNAAYEYISLLKKECDRIKNISEQLLSLASTDESEKEQCEINKIITSHPIDALISRLKNSGLSVDLKLAVENPAVRATASQLQQLLLQFIENAEEAMPDKGRLTVTTEIFNSEDGKYVFVTVADSGMGIPEENIARIFQPFFTTKGKSATGLGLMIATTIVENLRGTIGVRSKPGEGTAIRIALPLV